MFFFYSPLAFQSLFFIASMTPRSPLRQLLQEQQEPFELEDYLFERDYYSRTSLSRDSGFSCSGGKLDNIMKFGKGFVEINKMLKNSCKKLVSINRKEQTKDLGKNGWTFSVGCKRVAESDNFLSSCSSQETARSVSGKDNEETSSSTRRQHANSSNSNIFQALEPCNFQVLKAAAGEKLVSKSMEPRKQSLLRAKPNGNRLRNVTLQKKIPEDSILSATLWELLLYSAATEKTSGIETVELQELATSNAASHLLISKRVIHQTKQLLFNCVREVVKAHSKQGSRKRSEEIGGIIREKKAIGKEANLSNLLSSDYLFTATEWRDFKQQKQLIGTELGEFILKGIINEVVTELTEEETKQGAF